MPLTINRTHIEVLKGIRYVFYLTLVKIEGQWCSFVSQHKCEGLSDEQAGNAFTREHFAEVEQLVLQRMRNEVLN